MIEREEIINEDEILLVSFMTMNDDVLANCYSRYETGELKTKYFTQFFVPIIRLCYVYFEKYRRAPQYTINEIFKNARFRKDEADIIEEYLENMSEEYLRIKNNTSADVEYVLREVIPNFIRERQGARMLEDIEAAIRNNKTRKIDKIIQGYNFVEEEPETFEIRSPFSLDTVHEHFRRTKHEQEIFRLNNAAGQLLGPIRRKMFIALTGVEKAGKTTLALDLCFQAALTSKAKILWINMEMSEEDMNELFWRRLTGTASDREHAGKVISPVFDCVNNQMDICEVKKSLNGGRICSPGETAHYSENMNWQPCTQCRHAVKRLRKSTKRFIPAIWFKTTKVKVINMKRVKRVLEMNKMLHLENRIKLKTFPRLSATFGQMETYVRKVFNSGFNADIFVPDYLDILAPEEGKLLDRANIDYIWKKAAGLSQELNMALLSPDQASKAARNKYSLGRGDTSESKTKDAHLDLRPTINMTENEEDLGVQRLGVIFRRKGRPITKQVMLLQRKETGQTMIDCEWWDQKNTNFYVARD